MNEKIKNDGPAFPKNFGVPNAGMTLRDYFAAKAMQAYLTDIDLIWDEATIISAVEKSYLVADAMLAERERVE